MGPLPSGFRSWITLVEQCLPLVVASTLFSCASVSPAHRVKVDIPANYSGNLHVTLCQNVGTPADTAGNVSVVDCVQRSERIELNVRRGGAEYVIPPEKLDVRRTGDGIPVIVDAQLP